MNRTVKLYRSVKGPSGDWGTKPVPQKQLKNLEDLPGGDGKYYLAYYDGKHRRMPPVGRFADAAKQKLIGKRKELDARASGVELPLEPDPETKPESNLVACVEKYLSQMMSFVGNDGYGRSKNVASGGRNPGSCLGLLASLRGNRRHSNSAPSLMAACSERCGLITPPII